MSENCESHCHFSYLWPILSDPEARFPTHNLKPTLSLIATFYLIKTGNKIKIALT